ELLLMIVVGGGGGGVGRRDASFPGCPGERRGRVRTLVTVYRPGRWTGPYGHGGEWACGTTRSARWRSWSVSPYFSSSWAGCAEGPPGSNWGWSPSPPSTASSTSSATP